MTDIARGDIQIALNDRDALDGLRRVQREVHQAMREIGAESATADVSADIRDLKAKLKAARKDIEEFQSKSAEVTIKGNLKQLEKDAAEAKLIAKQLDGLHAQLKFDVDDDEAKKAVSEAKKMYASLPDKVRTRIEADPGNFNRAAQVVRDYVEELDGKVAEVKFDADTTGLKEAEAQLKTVEAAEKRVAKAERDRNVEMTRRARVMSSLHRQEMSEMRQAEAAAYKIDQERTRRGLEILNLQKQYARETDRLEAIARRKPVRREDHAKVELDAQGARQRMLVLKAELEALGSHPPVEIKVDVDRRAAVRGLYALKNSAAGILGKVGGLSDATIRLGPFTTSIKGAITALGILGPTILDVVGAASSLIGVLGAGIAGAATVGGAAMTGLGMAIAGTVLALKPLADQYKIATQATDAYQKAVLKYGKNSDQAKTAQEQMNNVLKQVDPIVASNAKKLSSLSSQWQKLVKPTQRNFGEIISDGLKTADDLMPRFAARTNQFSKTLRDGFKGAFEYLRGDGGNALDTIFGRFNKSMPTLLHGLGGFGEGIINVFRESSKYIDDFAEGFDNLGRKFSTWTKGDDLGPTIRRWVDSARDLVRFFGAASRVLTHFFGSGVSEGRQLVQTMTTALNRWDAWIQSAEGQDSLGEFFTNARKGVQGLYAALAPLIASFVEWAGNLSPIVTGFFQGAAAVSQMVAAITKLLGAGPALTTLGATLGAMWAVGKISSFVSMLSRVALGFDKITGSAAAARAATFQATAAGSVANATTRAPLTSLTNGIYAGRSVAPAVGAVEKVAAPLTRATRAANLAKGAMSGLGAATIGIANPIAGIGIAAAAAGAGLYLLLNREKGWEKAAKAAQEATSNYRAVLATLPAAHSDAASAYLSLSSATDSAAAAEKRVQKLMDQGKAGTREYREAVMEMRNARLAEYQTRQQAIALNQKEIDSSRQVYSEATKAVQARIDAVDDMKGRNTGLRSILDDTGMPTLGDVGDLFPKIQAEAKASGMAVEDYINKYETGNKTLLEFAEAQKQLRLAMRQQTIAQQQAALADLNRQRAMKGMVPMAQSAARAFATLQRQTRDPKVSSRIATQFDINAGGVARAAAKAVSSGMSGTRVLKVIGDTRDAQVALKRLAMAKLPVKTLDIVEKGGDDAAKKLERLKGTKLTKKEMEVAEKGGLPALQLLQKIERTRFDKKVLAIAERGGDVAMSTIRKINNADIRQKVARIALRDEASERIASIKASLAAIPRSINVVVSSTDAVVNRQRGDGRGDYRGGRMGERAGRRFATGGSPTRGQRVNNPMFLVGEEAPAHPEWVIATNPAYKKQNIGYWAQAGHDLGIPGFAKGGLNQSFPVSRVNKPGMTLSKMQVRAIFESVGFSPRQAAWFAEVTTRESQRQPGMVQYDPGDGNIGYGLTQITPGRGGANWGKNSGAYKMFQKLGGASAMRNPFINAKMAKYLFDHGGMQHWASSSNNIPMPTGNIQSVKGRVGLGGMQSVPGYEASLGWATKQIGKMADGGIANRGPAVDRLEKKFGQMGAQWCAMFVSEALVQAGLPKSLYKVGASVSNLKAAAAAGTHGFEKGVFSGKAARKGDVATFGTYHTGIVSGVDRKKGIIYTIEGNTSDPGGVARRSHSMDQSDLSILHPGYHNVAGKPGKAVKYVPGMKGYTYDERAARQDNYIASFDVENNPDALGDPKYMQALANKRNMQTGRIGELHDKLARLNKRIAGVQSVDARKRDLQARSDVISQLGSLQQSNRDTNASLSASFIDSRNPAGRLGDLTYANQLAQINPNDLQGAQTSNAKLADYYDYAAKYAPNKAKRQEYTLNAAQYRQASNDAAAQIWTGANPMGDALAGLYMQQQTNQVLNPINNAMTNMQLGQWKMGADMSPEDIQAQLSQLTGPGGALTYWQNEFPQAIASGVQSRIEWAQQGLQQAQQAADALTQQLHTEPGALTAGLAQAGLTVNLNDDFAATQNLVNWWSNEYQDAMASGVQSRIATAAGQLAQYQAQAKQLSKQLQEQPLQAQYALAQLTDSMEDDTDAIKALLNLHEAWLAQAQAIGDYGGIIEEAGVVKQLRDQLKNIQDTQAQQVGDFNAARLALYRTMGSNSAPEGVGQRIVNVTNNYKYVPEDPHTWSQNLAFELQAAL